MFDWFKEIFYKHNGTFGSRTAVSGLSKASADTYYVGKDVAANTGNLIQFDASGNAHDYGWNPALLQQQVVLTEAPITDHTFTGISVAMTAGEALAQSEVVYFKSDGKVWKAAAGAIATMPVMGLATAAISSAATGTILLQGIMRDDTWAWTVGGFIYASTSGALTQTAPTATDSVTQVVGLATNAKRIYFNPCYFYTTHV